MPMLQIDNIYRRRRGKNSQKGEYKPLPGVIPTIFLEKDAWYMMLPGYPKKGKGVFFV